MGWSFVRVPEFAVLKEHLRSILGSPRKKDTTIHKRYVGSGGYLKGPLPLRVRFVVSREVMVGGPPPAQLSPGAVDGVLFMLKPGRNRPTPTGALQMCHKGKQHESNRFWQKRRMFNPWVFTCFGAESPRVGENKSRGIFLHPSGEATPR